MPDPSPAQQVRALMDQISDAIEYTDGVAGVQHLSEAPGGGQAWLAPMHHDTITARDNLKQTLVSWALLIVEEHDVDYDTRDEATAVAAWIYQHADWLGAHPAIDDFIGEVVYAIHELHRIANRGVSARRPDLASTVHPDDALEVDLTAEDCATALTHLHECPITAKQILKLVEVDRRKVVAETLHEASALTPVRYEGRRPYFRVQEVLARANKAASRTRQQAS